MPHIRLAAGMMSVASIGLNVCPALGQSYPNKPIRIVAAEIGGGGEFTARLIAQGLASSLGQQVIVDNRGGSGSIPAEIVSKAPPDGYTLLVYGASMWIGTLLQKRSYDPIADFAPISLLTNSPNILVIYPASPVKSVAGLIALAKSNPSSLNFAAGVIGSSAHLAGELFNSMAGVHMVHVAYARGNGPALISVMTGETQLMFPSAAPATPHIKSGKLRALAVTSLRPSELAVGLPTVDASGLPGYESGSTQGIWAPAKTSAALVSRLNQNVVRFLNQPDIKQKFLNSGVDTIGSSPQEFATAIKAEMVKWNKVINEVGIRAD